MRKVTEKTAKALLHGQSLGMGNTHVHTAQLPNLESVGYLYLHGNLIATYERNNGGVNTLTITNCNWWTPTTKERLNGILKVFGVNWHIYQKDYTWFIMDFMKRSHEFYNNMSFDIDR